MQLPNSRNEPLRSVVSSDVRRTLFVIISIGCTKPPSGVAPMYFKKPYEARDPLRPEARHDRIAVNIYLAAKRGVPAPTLSPGYLDGNCAEAPDPEQRLYCEGKWRELRTAALVHLAYGTGVYSQCGSIFAATSPPTQVDHDLVSYCKGTQPTDSSLWFYCRKIKNPALAKICDERNTRYANHCPLDQTCGYGGGGESASEPDEPAPTPAPQPVRCQPLGAIVRHADDCCSERSDYASHATNEDRRQGRERVCVE